MAKKKILFINQEISPYVDDTHLSIMGRELPRAIQERGHEIRTFMPKWGTINERRGMLHEVQRLSGMNLIIDDTDHPLIIKVASIPAARMQIYFIDNDDFFARKASILDPETGAPCDDNDERAIFFARGVMETTKKLRWVPDVIHLQGWFTMMVAVFSRLFYRDDPAFSKAKIVVSLYADSFEGEWSKVADKLWIEGIDEAALEQLDIHDYKSLMRAAIAAADGVAVCEPEGVDPDLVSHAKELGKPVLDYVEDGAARAKAFSDFYASLF